jgi:hypothetical protein
VEWLKVKILSSSLSTAKKKKIQGLMIDTSFEIKRRNGK